MKIYLAHASSYDYKQELYLPLKNSTLFTEYVFILPHDGEAVHSKQALSECDLVIAEVSYPSTGLGIELGWANDLGKPIVCIHRSDSTPSSSLKFITQIFRSYATPEEIPAVIQTLL